MYLDRIVLENFRTFRKTEISFVHADQDFDGLGMPKPKLKNVNLLLGNNGFGKTTLLKAIALACLGPAVGDSGIFAYRLIRREGSKRRKGSADASEARLDAAFTAHPQDQSPHPELASTVAVIRTGDLEKLRWTHGDEKPWHPIYSATSDAFFFVGYGANRRVEKPTNIDLASRKSSAFARAHRVLSLFEETYSLIPLNTWLPGFKKKNKGRYSQIVTLINRLIADQGYVFTGEMEKDDYLFERGGLAVPFPALSDGYRAFLGWIGDLLYHVAETCPPGKKLVENRGIVMVDEIDLHLHPKWQMTVLPLLAKELPNLQFIVTSHSPLIVGSLEWMNIVVMAPGKNQASEAKRLEWSVHGLDADQVLLTDFFGLESTRAAGKRKTLKELTLRARSGDTEAAKQLLEQMSRGTEAN